MNLYKIFAKNSKKHLTSSSKKQTFIKPSNKEKKYKLKNTLTILLAKINFDNWKKDFKLQIIDILYNAFIICLIIIFWKQGSAFLQGLSITLFFIVLISYVKDFKKIFTR